MNIGIGEEVSEEEERERVFSVSFLPNPPLLRWWHTCILPLSSNKPPACLIVLASAFQRTQPDVLRVTEQELEPRLV